MDETARSTGYVPVFNNSRGASDNPIKKSFLCKLIPTQYGAGMLTAWNSRCIISIS